MKLDCRCFLSYIVFVCIQFCHLSHYTHYIVISPLSFHCPHNTYWFQSSWNFFVWIYVFNYQFCERQVVFFLSFIMYFISTHGERKIIKRNPLFILLDSFYLFSFITVTENIESNNILLTIRDMYCLIYRNLRFFVVRVCNCQAA